MAEATKQAFVGCAELATCSCLKKQEQLKVAKKVSIVESEEPIVHQPVAVIVPSTPISAASTADDECWQDNDDDEFSGRITYL